VPHATEDAPSYRSHYLPRTHAGRMATIAFFLLLAFAEPPLVFILANRIEPRLLGMPFLYVYLLAVYTALIVVLVWARRRGL
jgi:hypothetical protein